MSSHSEGTQVDNCIMYVLTTTTSSTTTIQSKRIYVGWCTSCALNALISHKLRGMSVSALYSFILCCCMLLLVS